MALVLSESLSPFISRLTLNSPKTFNVLSEAMMSSLHHELELVSKSKAKVVIVKASGKAFCTGHDIKEMVAKTPSKEYYQKLFTQCSDLMMLLTKIPQVVVGSVHGVATAAGCQLVSMCDLAVASKEAKFAVSGINLGLFCSTPSVGIVRNMHRKQALEMLLTGDFIDAKTAVERGLINHAVESDVLDKFVLDLCNKIAEKPAAAIRIGKNLFYKQTEMDLENAYKLASDAMSINMMDPDAIEGFRAFAEKRSPNWKKSL